MFRGPGHFMGAELEGEIPSYAEHDDFLVKVPALKELLCRGGFRHRWRRSSELSSQDQCVVMGMSFGEREKNLFAAPLQRFCEVLLI
jgi:hypothetical protein